MLPTCQHSSVPRITQFKSLSRMNSANTATKTSVVVSGDRGVGRRDILFILRPLCGVAERGHLGGDGVLRSRASHCQSAWMPIRRLKNSSLFNSIIQVPLSPRWRVCRQFEFVWRWRCVACCGVALCCLAWRCVAWHGVVLRGVMWRGVASRLVGFPWQSSSTCL